jgi:hypothetical protein
MCSRNAYDFRGKPLTDSQANYIDVRKDVILSGRSLCELLHREVHEYYGTDGETVTLGEENEGVPLLCLVYDEATETKNSGPRGGIVADTSMGSVKVPRAGYYRVQSDVSVLGVGEGSFNVFTTALVDDEPGPIFNEATVNEFETISMSGHAILRLEENSEVVAYIVASTKSSVQVEDLPGIPESEDVTGYPIKVEHFRISTTFVAPL